VASNLLRLSGSRAAEYAADAAAAELVPDGGMHLARALEKIEESTAKRDKLGGNNDYLSHMYIANSPGKSKGWFEKAGALLSTHPRTADRKARLVLDAAPIAAGVAGGVDVGQVTAFAAFGKRASGAPSDKWIDFKMSARSRLTWVASQVSSARHHQAFERMQMMRKKSWRVIPT